MRLVDREGQKIGKLLVLKRAPSTKHQTFWLCQCDCGEQCTVAAFRLNEEAISPQRSCGCIRYDRSQFKRTKGYEKALNWRRNNADSVRCSQRKFKLKLHYGLTIAQYESMLLAQGNLCAVCGETLPEKEGSSNGFPPVDHDHITGKPRGVVHGTCNKALGLLKDNPNVLRRAADYIEHNRREEPQTCQTQN